MNNEKDNEISGISGATNTGKLTVANIHIQFLMLKGDTAFEVRLASDQKDGFKPKEVAGENSKRVRVKAKNSRKWIVTNLIEYVMKDVPKGTYKVSVKRNVAEKEWTDILRGLVIDKSGCKVEEVDVESQASSKPSEGELKEAEEPESDADEGEVESIDQNIEPELNVQDLYEDDPMPSF